MKKSIKYIAMLCAAVVSLTFVGCDDPHTANLEDYQTLVYFRDGGVQALPLTRVEAQTVCRIPVCKSGRDLTAETRAEVVPMDQSQMDIYNIQNGTNYVVAGQDCFSITKNREMVFSSEDSYKIVELVVDTDILFEEQERMIAEGKTLVVAVQLYSPSTLSRGLNYVIFTPSLEYAFVTFAENFAEREYTSVMPEKNTYETTLSLNVENEWNFTCEIALQEDLEAVIAAVNEQYSDPDTGAYYSLLPEGAYSFSKTIEFHKGESQAPFTIEISRMFKNFLPDPDEEEYPCYVLPLEIKNISQSGIDTDANSKLLLLVSHEMRFIGLQEITLTADMISAYGTESNEGSVGALVDGNETTYWHSTWSKTMAGDPDFGAYIDIELEESMRYFQFSYCTRHSNNNGVPRKLAVGGSNDGTTWTVLRTDIDGTALSAREWATLPMVDGGTTYKYVRLGIIRSALGDLTGTLGEGGNNCTALAEITLQASVTKPTYQAVY